MSQFKVGDLALIIYTTHTPNIGKCVTLESRHEFSAGTLLPTNSEDVFIGRIKTSGVYWRITGDLCIHLMSTEGIDNGYVNVPYTYILERNLMPLKGDLEVKKVREELVLTGD